MNSGIRVVLVEPEYEINLGSIARVMENFGASELWLVRPKAKAGFMAKMFSKHAWHLLEKARVVKDLNDAVKGCSLVVGTTGVPRRFWKGIKNCVPLMDVVKKGKGKIALVFGGEGSGLRVEDVNKCDVMANIPTSKEYPVMNLSHAVAVALYEFYAKGAGSLYEPAPRGKLKQLESMFEEIVGTAPLVRDKKKVSRAFSQILLRARPGDDEAQALFAAFSGIMKKPKRRAD